MFDTLMCLYGEWEMDFSKDYKEAALRKAHRPSVKKKTVVKVFTT